MPLIGVPSAPLPSTPSGGGAFRRLGKETRSKNYIASIYQGRLTVFASLTDVKGLCLAELQRPILSDAACDNGILERTFASIMSVLAEVTTLAQINIHQLSMIILAYDSNNAVEYEWLIKNPVTNTPSELCCLGAMPSSLSWSALTTLGQHCDCTSRSLMNVASDHSAPTRNENGVSNRGTICGFVEGWLSWRFSGGTASNRLDPLRVVGPDTARRIIKHGLGNKTPLLKSCLKMCSTTLPLVMTSDLRAMMLGMGVKRSSLGVDIRDACTIVVPIDVARKSSSRLVNDFLFSPDPGGSIIPVKKLIIDGTIILDRLVALTHAYYDIDLLDQWASQPHAQSLRYIPASTFKAGGILGLTAETNLKDLFIAALRALAHSIVDAIESCRLDPSINEIRIAGPFSTSHYLLQQIANLSQIKVLSVRGSKSDLAAHGALTLALRSNVITTSPPSSPHTPVASPAPSPHIQKIVHPNMSRSQAEMERACWLDLLEALRST
eukprot:Blabericola_migrator_1__10721@NODE_612_length_7289_cov_45_683606_g445_i0_p3_GENE_NODE_612_length_7289_cov_45_683606_g445_i0NODE_612_length_7289_cov_45_683606_g445_i0_p3_ORF_typecomplete_len495_score42_58FGGY_C/PF02782_16/2_5e09_NODE_612_length_7289_cov_45_683606_g445_i0571541